MSATLEGRAKWEASRSSEGHREYTVINHVRTSDTNDGPQTVADCPGLPLIGAPWSYGNDYDPWAFCTPFMKIEARVTKEKTKHWKVTQKFSTQPINRCQDVSIEDPLMEPQKIGGSFIKYLEAITKDKDGDQICSLSGELLSSAQLEFDHHKATVWVEQNVTTLGLATFTEMMNTVNDRSLWGMSSRHIKLDNTTWERKIYGTCNYYYTRRFEFAVDFNGFDREVPDLSRKALGRWNRDTDPPTWEVPEGYSKTNKQHFNMFKDANGENTSTFLDDDGEPVSDVADTRTIDVEYYEESNFLLLGIPSTL